MNATKGRWVDVTITETRPAAKAGARRAVYDGLERGLVDVVRSLLSRPFTSALPSGERLDKAAYHVLARLEQCGEVRLSDLAAAAGLDVSTVSRQIRQLETAGLVTRRPDPDDGRAWRLLLSDLGQADLDAMRLERQSRIEAATTTWSRADLATLTTLLERLADGLRTDSASVGKASA